jgi:hypothetical protein
MRTKTTSWLILLLAVIGIGSAVGASAARDVIEMSPPAASVSELPMPALDRAVARMAAEARASAVRR